MTETVPPLRQAVFGATEQQVILLVTGSHQRAADLVEAVLGDLRPKGRGVEGDFTVGIHRILSVTPRSADRVRGLRADAVVMDDPLAYEAVQDVLLPCLLTAPKVRWFDRSGEVSEPLYVAVPSAREPK